MFRTSNATNFQVLNSFKHKIMKLSCPLLWTTGFRHNPIYSNVCLRIGEGTFRMCVRVSVYASQFDCKTMPCIESHNISFIGIWDLLVEKAIAILMFSIFNFYFVVISLLPFSSIGDGKEIKLQPWRVIALDSMEQSFHIPIRKHLLSILLWLLSLLKKKKKRKEITAIWDSK